MYKDKDFNELRASDGSTSKLSIGIGLHYASLDIAIQIKVRTLVAQDTNSFFLAL